MNQSIKGLRTDIGRVTIQKFEMENLNESLEQRLVQLRSQRELTIELTEAGLINDLKSELIQSEANAAKLVAVMNNTELSW